MGAENVNGIRIQLELKPGPKRAHLGAQEKGPSVQSLESPAFRGLVVKGERARREETKGAVTSEAKRTQPWVSPC